jgi:ABC-2 type transport system permease protein
MIGYVYLTIFLLLIGIIFFLVNVLGRSANFHFTLSSFYIFSLFLMPLLTMRLFSEEARQKTDQLIYTSPLSVNGIVMGKFFAAVTLFLVSMAVTALLPLLLTPYGDLPVSLIAGTFVGFILLNVCFIAIGVFVSVLTDDQIIAAVGTMGAITVLFFIDGVAAAIPNTPFVSLAFVIVLIFAVTLSWYLSVKKILVPLLTFAAGGIFVAVLYHFNNLIFDGIIIRALQWFSIYARFENFPQGILRLSDIVYYVSFSALFLFFTVNVIEKRRWR